MGSKTAIEWCEATWNVLAGCNHVSAGCASCWAERLLSTRLRHLPDYAGLTRDGRWTGEVRQLSHRLADPLHWRRPRRIFVAPHGDLFHEQMTDGQILRVFDVMFRAHWHTYQILTKRTERALSWLRKWHDTAEVSEEPMGLRDRSPVDVRRIFRSGRAHLFASMIETMGEPPEGCCFPSYDWMEGMRWWPSTPLLGNIWLGFSAENQETFDARWAHAREWAALGWPTWVSVEPMLGPVDVEHALGPSETGDCGCSSCEEGHTCSRGREPVGGLSWAVCGSESGPRRRLMDLDWARSLRDQCVQAGVPFYLKQATVCGQMVSMPELDGRVWAEFPEAPHA